MKNLVNEVFYGGGVPSIDRRAVKLESRYVKSIFELIVEGYLCPLRGLEVRTEVSVEEVGVHAEDFIVEELSRVINTRDRNRRLESRAESDRHV